MRVKTRSYLHYAPVTGGVYFSGARTQFVLRGPELLFRIADVCVPLLENGTTDDDLVAALGTERARPAVHRLVEALRDHGMLLDPDLLTVPEPPAAVREAFCESLAHLEAVSDDPYAVFARFRATAVLLCGPPHAVLPAARGLSRAGVGRLVLAVPDPGTVESAARRLAAEVLSSSTSELAGAAAAVDAVVYCVAGGPDLRVGVAGRGGWLPAGTPLVPVWLDDPDGRIAVAGPVLDAVDDPAWPAFPHRALAWATAERLDPVARPTSDALAGALAGQLVFHALTAGAVPGAAHVVHGTDLSADQVIIADRAAPGATREADRWYRLDQAEPVLPPEPVDAARAVESLAARWTGLFTPVMAADLPQLPVALRQVDHRSGRSGSVVAWAAEQQTVTVSAALAALRELCSEPDGAAGVGAAGLTEERWLLDGALRLLADRASPLDTVAVADLAPDARQMWQSLAGHGVAAVTVELWGVPGLDWRLGRVVADGTGEVLGRGWGRDGAEAGRGAMGTALARVQVRQVSGADTVDAGPHTDALLFADSALVTALRKQICADPTWARFRGRARRTDPLLGELPVWFGPVEVGPVDTDPAGGERADG